MTGLVSLLLLASLTYACGLFTRASGLVLWVGAVMLFQRNQLTLNPSLPYLGLWFLAQAFAHPCPPWSLDRWRAQRRGARVSVGADHLPPDALRIVWIVASVGYSFSGLTKLVSPSWLRGEAFSLILSSPLGRDHTLVRGLLALPGPAQSVATWAVLAAELSFAPLALSRRARPWIWTTLLAMHVGLVAVLDVADISVAMIAFHLLAFDPACLAPRGARSSARPPVPSRASHGLVG